MEKKGRFNVDLKANKLEIWQVSARIKEITPAPGILNEIYTEFKNCPKHPLK